MLNLKERSAFTLGHPFPLPFFTSTGSVVWQGFYWGLRRELELRPGTLKGQLALPPKLRGCVRLKGQSMVISDSGICGYLRLWNLVISDSGVRGYLRL